MESKNLFDTEKDFKNIELFLEENDKYITAIEINSVTLSYMQKRGIYGFVNFNNQKVKVIINDTIPNFYIEVHRKKRNDDKNEI